MRKVNMRRGLRIGGGRIAGYQHVVLGEIREWLSADGIEAEALEGGKTAWALACLIRSAPN